MATWLDKFNETYSIVVIWVVELESLRNQCFTLLGKQHGEHLRRGLALLQEIMRMHDQRFDHRLSLLPTDLPNGFDRVRSLVRFPLYR